MYRGWRKEKLVEVDDEFFLHVFVYVAVRATVLIVRYMWIQSVRW